VHRRPALLFSQLAHSHVEKSMRLLLITILVFISLNGKAQSDSIDYNHGVPIGNDDTVQNFPDNDLEPKTKLSVVDAEKLPATLRKALKTKSIYKGWDKFPVIFNHTTGLYQIRVVQAGDTTVLGVNKNGDTVTYGKGTVDDL
jgi:hypothetical protein